MIILLDTSTSTCYLTIVDGQSRTQVNWEAGRGLARGLLGFIRQELQKQHQNIKDISGIGVMKGPGSFTGLRIGLTLANTLADSLNIPIVGEMGENWAEEAISRLGQSQNDRIVMPFYGQEAHITQPKK